MKAISVQRWHNYCVGDVWRKECRKTTSQGDMCAKATEQCSEVTHRISGPKNDYLGKLNKQIWAGCTLLPSNILWYLQYWWAKMKLNASNLEVILCDSSQVSFLLKHITTSIVMHLIDKPIFFWRNSMHLTFQSIYALTIMVNWFEFNWINLFNFLNNQHFFVLLNCCIESWVLARIILIVVRPH